MARIPIVDRQDKIIGYKERKVVRVSDIVRTSALWLENSYGEVLIAQRAFHSKAYPGYWGVASTGTVEENESYETNMVKEADEEIGLSNFTYSKGQKFYIEEPTRHKFCQYFIASIDKPIIEFKKDDDEVADLKWIKKDWLFEDIKNNPDKYTPSLLEMVKSYNLY